LERRESLENVLHMYHVAVDVAASTWLKSKLGPPRYYHQCCK